MSLNTEILKMLLDYASNEDNAKKASSEIYLELSEIIGGLLPQIQVSQSPITTIKSGSPITVADAINYLTVFNNSGRIIPTNAGIVNINLSTLLDQYKELFPMDRNLEHLGVNIYPMQDPNGINYILELTNNSIVAHTGAGASLVTYLYNYGGVDVSPSKPYSQIYQYSS